MQWARPKMVQTFSDFHKEDADPDELIVLDKFVGKGLNEDGVEVPTVGLVVTSRILYKNLEKAIYGKIKHHKLTHNKKV